MKTIEAQLGKPKQVFALILLFAFVLYGNTVFNDYALDDHLVTTADHHQISKGITAIPEIFTTHFVSWNDYNVDYRPLVKASFAIEFELFGENPMVSHLINILLYAITCVLLWKVVILLFPEAAKWQLMLVLLLFMAHPVHTEVVASLKGRDELLSFLFLLGGFVVALNWSEKGSNWKLLLFATLVYLSLISKASSMPWLAILGFVLYRIRQLNWFKLALVAVVMTTVVIFHFTFISWLLEDYTRPHIFIETPFFLSDEPGVKWPSIITTAGYYLKLLVAPFPLCSYYGYDQIPLASWSDYRVYASILAYVGLAVLAVRSIKKPGFVSLGALILLLDIAPFLNVVYPYAGVLGERVLIGATAGFAMILVGGFTRLKKPIIGVSLALVLIVLGSVRTIVRNFDWKDNLTLFAADSENCDRSAKLHELYALYLRGAYINNDIGDSESLAYQAIRENKRSIEIYNDWPIPHHRIGVIYHYDLALPDSARSHYEQAVQLNPDFIIARGDLAECLMELGDHSAAAAQFDLLVQDDPSDPNLWNRYVTAHFLSGQMEDAFQANAGFLRNFPDREEPHIHQGNLVMSAGDTSQAFKHFEMALQVNPDNEAFRNYVEGLNALYLLK